MIEGRNDALAGLYAEYGKRVHRLAYGISGDSELARDVVQDTFVQVAKGLEGFRGNSSVETWIYAIAKNECMRNMARIRRGSIRALQAVIDTAASPEPPGLVAIERGWYAAQVKEGCLLGLLRCLSFYQRMAFILCILFDLPAREVSRILKKSTNSVRILASRARAKIKDFLCANCSLYDSENACRCESFIAFSIKNDWIKKYDPEHPPAAIEAELAVIKNEVLLYKGLFDRGEPAPSLETRIAGEGIRGPWKTKSEIKVLCTPLKGISINRRRAMKFLVKVRVNVSTMSEFGAALGAGALDRSAIRGETYCLADDPAVGYSVWETSGREELDARFGPWRRFYRETEVVEVISPQEAMEKLMKGG